MSKTRLGDLLAEHGIRYEHHRAFGTPADLRALYRAGREAEGHAAMRAHLEAHAAAELDVFAAALATAPPTALLCLEADPRECHRSVLAERLRARLPGLVVIDLLRRTGLRAPCSTLHGAMFRSSGPMPVCPHAPRVLFGRARARSGSRSALR
jgi:uncharacterized protein (DUF488 family)